MEAMFEYRMVNFFAPDISSARLLRFVFILFSAFFAWAYNSNIRANLLTKDIPNPVNTYEVNVPVYECTLYRSITVQGISGDRFKGHQVLDTQRRLSDQIYH